MSNDETKSLLPFISNHSLKTVQLTGIRFSLTDYFELTEWTGRARDDKKGHIPPHIQSILQKLGVQEDNWLNEVKNFGRRFGRIVGPVEKLSAMSNKLGLWWVRGSRNCQCLYAAKPD